MPPSTKNVDVALRSRGGTTDAKAVVIADESAGPTSLDVVTRLPGQGGRKKSIWREAAACSVALGRRTAPRLAAPRRVRYRFSRVHITSIYRTSLANARYESCAGVGHF